MSSCGQDSGDSAESVSEERLGHWVTERDVYQVTVVTDTTCPHFTGRGLARTRPGLSPKLQGYT